MITTQPFGRTGHNSTRTIFGAAALGKVTQAEADATLELLLQHGINHIDTAASYGEAELRIGPWMKEHRKNFFLATKTGERTKQKAREQIHKSLERLRVDSVDLIQLHALTDESEWEMAMGADGALEAAIEAREQGLTRFIGVTGHGVVAPTMHKKSLERFDFDSILFPYSYLMMQNPQYAADTEALLTLCKSRDVAVQTIKALVRAPWGEKQHHRATWYEPLEDQKDIDNAVHWVLGNDQVFLNTAGDIHLLPKVLDAASRFKARPTNEKMQVDLKQLEMSPLFV
ncbi:MAG: aldo/keto reductase [Chloroflexi bacterium]|nr:aldo/keto reductase [Chloroflexota bacterium]